jgi:hypothetical protein
MDLSTFKTRILDELGDPTGTRFTAALVEQALRQAVNEYSLALPLLKRLAFTIATAGRNQKITSISAYSALLNVYYPYDSSSVLNPSLLANCSYYATFDGTQLELTINGPKVPQVGEQIYLVYTLNHTVKDLDSAAATTINPSHDLLIIQGAAGLAAVLRASSVMEVYSKRPADIDNLLKWGNVTHLDYLVALQLISRTSSPDNPYPSTGFTVDRWDREAS